MDEKFLDGKPYSGGHATRRVGQLEKWITTQGSKCLALIQRSTSGHCSRDTQPNDFDVCLFALTLLIKRSPRLLHRLFKVHAETSRKEVLPIPYILRKKYQYMGTRKGILLVVAFDLVVVALTLTGADIIIPPEQGMLT